MSNVQTLDSSPPPALNRKGIWQERYNGLEIYFLRRDAPLVNVWTIEDFDTTDDATCFVRAAYAYFKRKGLILKTARRKEEPLKVWCQLKARTTRGEVRK